jgi:DNA polymerase epsilon subunit 1
MIWEWKGDFVPAGRADYETVKSQLESERFLVANKQLGFHELSLVQQQLHIDQRLKSYSKKVYICLCVCLVSEKNDKSKVKQNKNHKNNV